MMPSGLPRSRALTSFESWPYKDYGPVMQPTGTWRGRVVNSTYSMRPWCDMCGPFRGRLLRVVGSDQFGEIHRCKGCDDENES